MMEVFILPKRLINSCQLTQHLVLTDQSLRVYTGLEKLSVHNFINGQSRNPVRANNERYLHFSQIYAVFPGYHMADTFVLIKTMSLLADRQENVQNSNQIDQCLQNVGQGHIYGISTITVLSVQKNILEQGKLPQLNNLLF